MSGRGFEVEIETLAIHGAGRAWARRASDSFQRALPTAMASRPPEGEVHRDPGRIEMPHRPGQSAEAFGRDLARRVARALVR